MKNSLIILIVLLSSLQFVNAQETNQVADSVLVAKQAIEKQKQELDYAMDVQKKLDKAEKAQKKAEKAEKKALKKAKKQEKLAKAIASRKKAINKSEMKIRKLQSKLAKGKSKGKISPVGEMEINQKINKLELAIAKDKEKLTKLEQK